MPEVLVPPARWPRWVTNFAASHGEPTLRVDGGVLRGTAPDGSWFSAGLPFSRSYAGPAEVDALLVAVAAGTSAPWGVLLVRKGGFAVARVEAGAVVASKVGQRHVQGRTKAGGQSQQRFARRRANQARVAYEAAADHAVRVLAGVGEVVAGGDRGAVDEVLADPRLGAVGVVGPWLAVPDPRRGVLDRAVADAQSLVVTVENAGQATARGG
ncbi:acVLRF1 family peptidyl-tRNA hydrolase [Nocardioides sp. LHD-245]|uniref:acVLRF1 family peptidyl-tRNA hydrolase n=1 Tax=Nocardioides sp. LHD-245 TaxID=3051387 RepID=UPI0027DED271|nr:acVLRF1 family peptidyl-tRNA hydrolase [Nocardioides sp. LHD-245]